MGMILSKTWKNTKEQWATYLQCFLFQCFIELIGPLSEMFGLNPGEMPYVFIQLLVGLLSIWNFCLFIHIFSNNKRVEKLEFMDLIKESILDTPTLFLYSLLYSFTVIAGLLLFVLPGFYVLLFHYFTPIIAVIDPELENPEESYFAYSRRLVRSKQGVVIGSLSIAGILNAMVPLTSLVLSDQVARFALATFLSPIESFMILFANLLILHTYQSLKEELAK